MASDQDRLPALERELAELSRQMPYHSPKPSLLLRLEELEEEIARLRADKEGD